MPDRHGGRLADTQPRHELTIHPAGDGQHLRAECTVCQWATQLVPGHTSGLLRYGHRLTSSDSLAWSYNARKHPPLPGCTHKSCANCPRWADQWRQRLLAKLAAATAAGRQGDLFDPDDAWEAREMRRPA